MRTEPNSWAVVCGGGSYGELRGGIRRCDRSFSYLSESEIHRNLSFGLAESQVNSLPLT